MTTLPLPQLHPFPEVAKRLGISLRSLRSGPGRGSLIYVRIGRERYLTDAQLAALIEAYTVSSKRSDDLAKTAERVTRRRSRPGQRAA